MDRSRFIVKGRVQMMGYRAFVKLIGRQLGVKGLVRNLEDGTVEIFCEAEGRIIRQFKQVIDKKSPSDDPLSINVEKIVEYPEGNKAYINAPEKFEVFEMDYGDERLSPFEKESLERSETAILVFGKMGNEMKDGFSSVKNEVKHVGEKVDGVGEKVGQVCEKVDSMHEDMTKSFNKLDEKYGVIFETLITTNETLKSMNENMRVTQRELIESRKEFREEFSNSREQLAKAVDKLTVIVDRFIENESNKDKKT